MADTSVGDPSRFEVSRDQTHKKRKASNAEINCALKKRKLSFVAYDRLTNARRRDSIPIYNVKMSRENPDQQRGIDWLKTVGKDRFEEELTGMLSQWGVKKTHKDTCVLCPED